MFFRHFRITWAQFDCRKESMHLNLLKANMSNTGPRAITRRKRHLHFVHCTYYHSILPRRVCTVLSYAAQLFEPSCGLVTELVTEGQNYVRKVELRTVRASGRMKGRRRVGRTRHLAH